VVRQLQQMGAPEDVVQAAKAQTVESECHVFPDCWQAVELFLTFQSQWRIAVGAGGAIYQGLDFSAIEPGLRLLNIKKKDRAQLFKDLVLMSDEAASVINQRMSKAK
jgi:hypothetical protein